MKIVQAVLAAMFAMAGVMKATQPKDKLVERLPWSRGGRFGHYSL